MLSSTHQKEGFVDFDEGRPFKRRSAWENGYEKLYGVLHSIIIFSSASLSLIFEGRSSPALDVIFHETQEGGRILEERDSTLNGIKRT